MCGDIVFKFNLYVHNAPLNQFFNYSIYGLVFWYSLGSYVPIYLTPLPLHTLETTREPILHLLQAPLLPISSLTCYTGLEDIPLYDALALGNSILRS